MSKSLSLIRNKMVMAGAALLLTASMMLLPGMNVVKADSPVNATVTIKTTVMDGANGSTIVNAEPVTITTPNPTLKDAIEAASVATGVDVTIESTGWGYYVSAVEVDGHSSTNKFFGANGAASSDAIAGGNDYFYNSDIAGITAPAFINTLYGTSNFWTNTVATTNYLTEKDYNYNSGWMVELNNDNYANWGIDTALTNNDNIELDFTMFGSADLGGTAYVLGTTATSPSSGPWVAVSPFNL